MDQTDGLNRSIRACVRQDVGDGADLIVVSCAPFHWAIHVGEELQKYRKGERPKFIMDLRDPWSSNELAYFNGCSPSELGLEKVREQRCWEMADHVLLVEQSLKFESISGASTWTVIPNGADMRPLSREFRRSFTDEVHAVFLGTLYRDGLSDFLGMVNEMMLVCKELGLEFRCSIAGRWLEEHRAQLSAWECCTYLGFLNREELMELWSKADLGLSVLSETMTYALNTKILECISMQKPVLVVANEGPVSRFVGENALGFSWNPSQGADRKHALNEWVVKGMPIGPSLAHMKYDQAHLVDTLENVFREL